MSTSPPLTASLGWIIFSELHRERVGSVLDMLRPEGMLDELGLGVVRDALANELFPGISTIQTRAKYFFIIPYILADYERLQPAQRRKQRIENYLKRREHEVMWQLSSDERYAGKTGTGVIGITIPYGKPIARRPSAIYWAGLVTYGFIRTGGLAAASFLRQAARVAVDPLGAALREGDDTPDDAGAARSINMFRLAVESYAMDWQDELSLDLSKEEAEIFRDKVLDAARGRLIARLLEDGQLWQCFEQAGSFSMFARAAIDLDLPPAIRERIILAHDYSELMHGAHIFYNLLLQRAAFPDGGYWESEWRGWVEMLEEAMIAYSGFDDTDSLKFAPRTRGFTKAFIAEWWTEAKTGFKNESKLVQLIRTQEARAKGAKARLANRKLDDVAEDRWIGLERFQYRYPQARTIIGDILTGLVSD